MGKMNNAFILFVLSFCLFVSLRGGGGQWVGAITFTKDGIFTSCTNEMSILWYNRYRKIIFVGNSETCLFLIV